MVNRIDPSKTPEANLYDLISKSNNGLSIGPNNATLGTPSVLATPVGNRDTEIPVVALQDKGFSGTTKIRYNRLALNESVKSAPTNFLLAVTDTFETLKAKIIAAYGLIASEVVFNGGSDWALPTGSGATATLSMAPKAGSLMYNGNAINLTIARPQTATTYDDFVKWANANYGTNTLNPDGTARIGAASQTSAVVKQYEYLGTPATANAMGGTPVGDWYTFDSTPDRVIQHLLPSQAAWQDYYTNKRRCVIKQGPYTTRSSYPTLTRNGYTSNKYTQYGGHQATEFIYWDEAAKRPMRWVNPTTVGTSPVPFSLASGEAVFTTPGTIQWTVPDGVFAVSAVAIGAGASSFQYGGNGAGLGWKNDIPVTPGDVITIVVGAAGTPSQRGNYVAGGDSYFKSISLVAGLGATTGSTTGSQVSTAARAGFAGDGGGAGGLGGYGGGGTGGYAGNGGDGCISNGNAGNNATDGAGGAGGGGGVGEQAGGAGGGGVAPYGQGTNGGRGTSTTGTNGAGGGISGSGGETGGNSTTSKGGNGGKYGAGSGAVPPIGSAPSIAGQGVVRLVWGYDRRFPANNVAASASSKVTTY